MEDEMGMQIEFNHAIKGIRFKNAKETGEKIGEAGDKIL